MNVFTSVFVYMCILFLFLTFEEYSPQIDFDSLCWVIGLFSSLWNNVALSSATDATSLYRLQTKVFLSLHL